MHQLLLKRVSQNSAYSVLSSELKGTGSLKIFDVGVTVYTKSPREKEGIGIINSTVWLTNIK